MNLLNLLSLRLSKITRYRVIAEKKKIKRIAPGEARTHGLQIMRLTRCLLRYGGLVNMKKNIVE
jgi:hypothetical protein